MERTKTPFCCSGCRQDGVLLGKFVVESNKGYRPASKQRPGKSMERLVGWWTVGCWSCYPGDTGFQPNVTYLRQPLQSRGEAQQVPTVCTANHTRHDDPVLVMMEAEIQAICPRNAFRRNPIHNYEVGGKGGIALALMCRHFVG